MKKFNIKKCKCSYVGKNGIIGGGVDKSTVINTGD